MRSFEIDEFKRFEIVLNDEFEDLSEEYWQFQQGFFFW